MNIGVYFYILIIVIIIIIIIIIIFPHVLQAVTFDLVSHQNVCMCLYMYVCIYKHMCPCLCAFVCVFVTPYMLRYTHTYVVTKSD
jgi:hypothetical protein